MSKKLEIDEIERVVKNVCSIKDLTFVKFRDGKYENNTSKLEIMCNKDGKVYHPSYANFVKIDSRSGTYRGCPECAIRNRNQKNKHCETNVINIIENKIRERELPISFLMFENGKYSGHKTKVKFWCHEHSITFNRRFDIFNNNKNVGCPECGKEKHRKCEHVVLKDIEIRALSLNYTFLKYDNKDNRYKGFKTKIILECPKHGEFKMTVYSFLRNKSHCPFCKKGGRVALEIKMWLDTTNVSYEMNNRRILNGLELDFWFPESNFAIEFQGNYFHANPKIFSADDIIGRFRAQEIWDRDEKKKELCAKKNIKLYQIWEDEWNNNKEDIKKVIVNETKKK